MKHGANTVMDDYEKNVFQPDEQEHPTPSRQPHPHEKCHECHVFFKCEQLPPCATHTSAQAPEPATAPCPQHRIWQHCPVAAQVAKAAREQFAELIEDKLPRYPSDLGDMYLLSDIQEMAQQGVEQQ